MTTRLPSLPATPPSDATRRSFLRISSHFLGLGAGLTIDTAGKGWGIHPELEPIAHGDGWHWAESRKLRAV
ncbi:hypothetical protein [Cupriavidus sp. U2]|uniref:hypothetical protein n=1 Tax=Cupriavidus sp. U2 TaxID=2920269 RepID=UPI00129E0349|nr:hypothetical protein [Cupriavidus sp. U2]